jgi:hypothetical protein
MDRNFLFLGQKNSSSSTLLLLLLMEKNISPLVEEEDTSASATSAFPSSESPLSCISCSATSISDSEKSMRFWVLRFLHLNVDFAITCPLRNRHRMICFRGIAYCFAAYIERLGRLQYFIFKSFFFINIFWPMRIRS